jgi:hypothetical protein
MPDPVKIAAAALRDARQIRAEGSVNGVPFSEHDARAVLDAIGYENLIASVQRRRLEAQRYERERDVHRERARCYERALRRIVRDYEEADATSEHAYIVAQEALGAVRAQA